MKKLFFFLSLGLMWVFFWSTAYSQFLGQLNTAKTFGRGEYNVGGYLGAYNDAIAVFGQFRTGITDYLDFGLKLGFLDFQIANSLTGWDEGHAGPILGGDLKYRLMEKELGDPFDLSTGMVFEYSSMEDFNRLALGGSLIISRDFLLESKNTISPYGRLNIRGERASWSHSFRDYDHSNTDLEAGFTLGGDLQVKEGWHFVAELQFEEYFGFLTGISYYIH
jgi:hypothetical protein